MRRFFLAPLFLLVLTGSALAALSFPALTGHVVDEAGILSTSGRYGLDRSLQNYEQNSPHHDQVVVVTLKSLRGTTIEDYGYQLGRAWGIGQKDKNNGTLLIVAPKEHKVRIEVGYGLEGTLTDAICSDIIQSTILPAFKSGQMEDGITAGTDAILSVLKGEPYSSVVDSRPVIGSTSGNASSGPNPGDLIASIFMLGLLCILFVRALWNSPSGSFGAYLGDSLVSGSMGSFSGGSFGGGFSGGGGSFGGGGASGGW